MLAFLSLRRLLAPTLRFRPSRPRSFASVATILATLEYGLLRRFEDRASLCAYKPALMSDTHLQTTGADILLRVNAAFHTYLRFDAGVVLRTAQALRQPIHSTTAPYRPFETPYLSTK